MYRVLLKDDLTVRVLETLFKVIPGTPAFTFYRTIDEAAPLVAPTANLEQARAYATEAGALRALKVANAIDTGDVGISVYTGLRSALKFFQGDRKAAARMAATTRRANANSRSGAARKGARRRAKA